MKDRFHNAHVGRQLRRQGSEAVDGEWPRRFATSQVMIEAIMYGVRERGLAALKEPDNIKRLRRCDEAAHKQINERIEKLLAGAT